MLEFLLPDSRFLIVQRAPSRADRRSVFGEEGADGGQTASAAWPQSLLTERRPPTEGYAAQEPLRYNMSATSTLARSVRAMASQFFSHRSSVFHE